MNKIRISFDIKRDLHLAIRRFAGLNGEPVSYYLVRLLKELHTDEKFAQEINKIKITKENADE